MDFTREWTFFALEEEVHFFGVHRLVEAHNKHVQQLEQENAKLRADIESVMALGTEFGFDQTQPYCLGQVLTHVRYLQRDRAEQLYQAMTLRAELERRKLKWIINGSDIPDENAMYWVRLKTQFTSSIHIEPPIVSGNNVNPIIHDWSGPIEPPEE